MPSVELSQEQISQIVVDELKAHYSFLHHDVDVMLHRERVGDLPSWKYEDLNSNTRTLRHIEGVLEFYLSDEDFRAWLSLYEDDEVDTPTINVTGVDEHPDGSATISFELDPESYAAFAKQGVKDALLKAAEQGCQNGNDGVDQRHD